MDLDKVVDSSQSAGSSIPMKESSDAWLTSGFSSLIIASILLLAVWLGLYLYKTKLGHRFPLKLTGSCLL